jgi:diguanylate cyclase (GGDEF)-like protein
MVLRWYASVTFALVAGYLATPVDDRVIPFLLVTLGAIPAVAIGARRSPSSARLPWWLLLSALVLFNIGNVAWIVLVYVQHRPTGDGTVADLFFNVANVLMLAGAMIVVVRRGRRDSGGVIDAAITALALGGLVWDAVLLPYLGEIGAPMSRQAALFVDVFVMMGALGALIRVTLVAAERIPAMRMLVAGMALGLVANVLVTLFTDPVTMVRPDWTNLPFLVAYGMLGCAALHPSSALITRAGAAPEDDLSGGRLAFLGVMLALIPLVGGGRVILGRPTDGILVAIGSAGVIPLVMIRIARLSRQRKRAEHALRRMATVDSLTGLPNRAACLDWLSEALAVRAAGVPPLGLAVLFCDLDGFKPVNDRLGHAAGDELLIEVADRLHGCLREADLVSRFGGDEFVIMCRDTEIRVAVAAVSARIRAVVAEPLAVGGEEVRIGLSVGVAYADDFADVDELLGRADTAMYSAKASKSIGTLSLVTA